MRTYPSGYPSNTFIEGLNTITALSRLDSVAFTNIIGNVGDETIADIRVGDPSVELLDDPEKTVLWGHGKPDGYDSLISDRGIELGEGDGTVPTESAKSIIADETIELSSGHRDLPSEAADIVYKTLTGIDTTANVVKKSQPTSLLLVQPFSPVDIQIVSPSGLKAGKDFETGEILNGIPGAYYTGYAGVTSEFITIPNPERGSIGS